VASGFAKLEAGELAMIAVARFITLTILLGFPSQLTPVSARASSFEDKTWDAENVSVLPPEVRKTLTRMCGPDLVAQAYFAGYFAKYALLKLGKRLEHQQRFDFQGLVDRWYARGFQLTGYARVPAGFSWMNDARTKRLQGPFTRFVAALHRSTGIDLGRDANFVLRLTRTGQRGVRRVTHVCRECGEHSILDGTPWPKQWTCPWCGKSNPLGARR